MTGIDASPCVGARVATIVAMEFAYKMYHTTILNAVADRDNKLIPTFCCRYWLCNYHISRYTYVDCSKIFKLIFLIFKILNTLKWTSHCRIRRCRRCANKFCCWRHGHYRLDLIQYLPRERSHTHSIVKGIVVNEGETWPEGIHNGTAYGIDPNRIEHHSAHRRPLPHPSHNFSVCPARSCWCKCCSWYNPPRLP